MATAMQLPSNMQPIDVPGVTPQTGQSAGLLGETADKVVGETLLTDVPPDKRNVVSEAHVAIRVRCWKINDDGTPYKDANGDPVEMPGSVPTINKAALAAGTVVLDNQLATYVMTALQCMVSWLNVRSKLASMARVPQ